MRCGSGAASHALGDLHTSSSPGTQHKFLKTLGQLRLSNVPLLLSSQFYSGDGCCSVAQATLDLLDSSGSPWLNLPSGSCRHMPRAWFKVCIWLLRCTLRQ